MQLTLQALSSPREETRQRGSAWDRTLGEPGRPGPLSLLCGKQLFVFSLQGQLRKKKHVCVYRCHFFHTNENTPPHPRYKNSDKTNKRREKGVTPWLTLAKVMGFVCLIFMGVELTYSVGSRVQNASGRFFPPLLEPAGWTVSGVEAPPVLGSPPGSLPSPAPQRLGRLYGYTSCDFLEFSPIGSGLTPLRTGLVWDSLPETSRA